MFCEIGGTVGDIESLPFIEAIRQLRNELGKENSVNLNLAITYSEMNQIDKAKELLNKIKLDQLEEEEKNTYQTISQKLK